MFEITLHNSKNKFIVRIVIIFNQPKISLGDQRNGNKIVNVQAITLLY